MKKLHLTLALPLLALFLSPLGRSFAQDPPHEERQERFIPKLSAFGSASYNGWFDVYLLYDSIQLGGEWKLSPTLSASLRYLQDGELYFQEKVEIENNTEIRRFVDTFLQGGNGAIVFKVAEDSPWIFSLNERVVHENAIDNRYDNGLNVLSLRARHSAGEMREMSGEYHWSLKRHFSFERLNLNSYMILLSYQDDFGLDPWHMRLSLSGAYLDFPDFIVLNSASADSGEWRRDFTFGISAKMGWFFGTGWHAGCGYKFEWNDSTGDEFDATENIFLHDYYDYRTHQLSSTLEKKIDKFLYRWVNSYEYIHFPSRQARRRTGRLEREDRIDNNFTTSLEASYSIAEWWQIILNYTLKANSSTDKDLAFKLNFGTQIFTIATSIEI
ncbi:MAG: hypothetical protein HY391_03085 [Deltaproteobacteria bacterium]|nr:hypothetical protein [Deltaproteobacteria bacterium]